MTRPHIVKRWRILLVGDADTGKTTFFQRIVKKQKIMDPFNTIGADFHTYKTSRENQSIELHVWDTAGRLSFRNITKSYFHGTDLFLLFFDSAQKSCLKNLKGWVEDIQEKNTKGAPIFLIINKTDIAEEHKLPLETVMREALDLNLKKEHFYLLSLKEGEGENILRDCIDTLWGQHVHPLNTVKTDWEEPALVPRRTWFQYFLSFL